MNSTQAISTTPATAKTAGGSSADAVLPSDQPPEQQEQSWAEIIGQQPKPVNDECSENQQDELADTTSDEPGHTDDASQAQQPETDSPTNLAASISLQGLAIQQQQANNAGAEQAAATQTITGTTPNPAQIATSDPGASHSELPPQQFLPAEMAQGLVSLSQNERSASGVTMLDGLQATTNRSAEPLPASTPTQAPALSQLINNSALLTPAHLQAEAVTAQSAQLTGSEQSGAMAMRLQESEPRRPQANGEPILVNRVSPLQLSRTQQPSAVIDRQQSRPESLMFTQSYDNNPTERRVTAHQVETIQAQATQTSVPQWRAATLGSNSQAWGQKLVELLADKIQLQVGQQHSRAQMRLDPPRLGSIDMVIQVEPERTSVQLYASNTQIREAIQSNLDQLRQQLGPQMNGELQLSVDINQQADYHSEQQTQHFATDAEIVANQLSTSQEQEQTTSTTPSGWLNRVI